MDIGVGDYVECVDASQGMISDDCGLVLGAIYQVERLEDAYHGRTLCESCGVHLVGMPCASRTAGWDISRFRPVYHPKQSIIEALKAPRARPPEAESGAADRCRQRGAAQPGHCPACDHGFPNLKRHIEAKHPEFVAEAVEGEGE